MWGTVPRVPLAEGEDESELFIAVRCAPTRKIFTGVLYKNRKPGAPQGAKENESEVPAEKHLEIWFQEISAADFAQAKAGALRISSRQDASSLGAQLARARHSSRRRRWKSHGEKKGRVFEVAEARDVRTRRRSRAMVALTPMAEPSLPS